MKHLKVKHRVWACSDYGALNTLLALVNCRFTSQELHDDQIMNMITADLL